MADEAEVAALRREVAELRSELHDQRRLQRLIEESHALRARSLLWSAQIDDPDEALRARVAELETSLRLVTLSRPYRVARAVRRALDALAPNRSAPTAPRRASELDELSKRQLPSGRGRPVVIFLPWLTHGGGGDQFARDLADALVADGRTVAIVVTHGCPPETADATAATMAITPYVFDLPSLLDPEDWPLFCERLLSKLEHPVIVNVGSTWLYRHLKRLRRGAASDDVKVIDQLFNHVGHVTDDVMADDAIDHTVVAHDGLRRLLVEHYGVSRPVTTIHVGLRSLGDPPPRTERSGRPVVAWLGRLSREKRPLWFVELARRLDGTADFVLAGTGPQLREVARAAHGIPSLELRGFVEDGVAFLDQADLLVVTSEVEGISVVAMEAIARGIPVVSTDVGGMADLVQPQVNGEIVPPDDLDDLVRVVEALVDAPGELQRLQDRVRAAGLPEPFTVSTMVERYRELLS